VLYKRPSYSLISVVISRPLFNVHEVMIQKDPIETRWEAAVTAALILMGNQIQNYRWTHLFQNKTSVRKVALREQKGKCRSAPFGVNWISGKVAVFCFFYIHIFQEEHFWMSGFMRKTDTDILFAVISLNITYIDFLTCTKAVETCCGEYHDFVFSFTLWDVAHDFPSLDFYAQFDKSLFCYDMDS